MKYLNKNNCLLIILITLLSMSLIGGCGGSGNDESGGNSGGGNQTISMEEASRFLSMATLGADYEEIEKVASIGREQWIDQQFNQPAGYNLPFTLELLELAYENEFEDIEPFRRFSWWQEVMTSLDLLRQRIAFALSEIFVVSDRVAVLGNHPEGLSSYYDVLLKNAFGNFRDLFLDVTLHPVMGIYLSHINNMKADPEINRFPDENYARESMQLFSIGLDLLNPDGTIIEGPGGLPIATYDNSNITEFAKIFTGLVSAPPDDSFFQEGRINFLEPMVMNENQHEPGEKILLNGQVVPSGQTGMQDIEAAIDNLFNHPNTGPFISKKLIQRLVTSNPAPDYVERVANVFANNGQGVRGDMKAVIKAILLDPDATNMSQANNSEFGKFHEPWVRYVALLRHFNATTPNNYYFNTGYLAQFFLNQHVLSSPSVFNFFLPDFKPNGIIGENNLVAPEFQIITSSTIINHPNMMFIVTILEELMSVPEPDRNEEFFFTIHDAAFDFSDEIAIANDPQALVDRLDLILTYGQMSDGMKQIIIDAISNIDEEDALFRVQSALYLFMISPEYVVQN